MKPDLLWPPVLEDDAELYRVEARLYELDPTGDRVATVIRDTYDQLYDGQRTGRWKFDQLHKTEKTHMGTLIEINLHREFGFDDGEATDYRIDVRERIFNARARSGNRHGQACTNEIFRLVHGKIIRRAELATVAQQDDPMKRARGNGGGRTYLRSEGILVLGHQDNDPLVAASLGLLAPRKGEFVAARVTPVQPDRSDPVAEIEGERWALARPDDPVVMAPIVARSPRSND